MKQLFYTSCKPQEGLKGRAGLQVRAASRNAGEFALQAAVRYAYYFLPLGEEFRPDLVKPEDAPIRLAFLQTPELGPAAVHAVYYGLDPASGRPGNPFVHMVWQDEAEQLDAYRVLLSWQSPFWQTDAQGRGQELEDVARLPDDGLDESVLRECAEEEGWREQVSFLLNAFLQLEEGQQVFLVGEPFQIVGLLLAVARLVPGGARRQLTFTTYERDVEGQSAKFVGTTWGKLGSGYDLPDHCYAGRGVTLNLKSGRRSSGLAELEYTRHAVRALCEEKLESDVDPFLRFCDECGLTSPRDLQAAFRSFAPALSPTDLGRADLEAVFRYPPLARHAFESSAFRLQLLAVMESDPPLVGEFAAPLRAHLAAQPEAAAALAEQAYQDLLERARAGATARFDSFRQHILPLLGGAPNLLLRLFRELADQQQPLPCQSLPAATWLSLNGIWQSDRQTLAEKAPLARWLLAGDADQFQQLLAAVGDRQLLLRIWSLNLRQGLRPSADTLRQFFAEPGFVALVLQNLAQRHPHALPHATRLLDTAPAGYLLQLLEQTDEPDLGWLLPLLDGLDIRDGETLLKKYGAALLPRAAGEPAWDRFLTRLEAADHALLVRHKRVAEVYETALEQGCLSDRQLGQRIRGWGFVQQLLEQGFLLARPAELQKRLEPIQSDLETLEDGKYLDDLFLTLARAGDAQEAVFKFGPALLSSTARETALLRSWQGICRAVLADRRLAREQGFVKQLLRIRAGVIAPKQEDRELFQNQPVLDDAGVVLVKGLPSRTREAINKECRQWPRRSQELWREWSDANQSLYTRFRNWLGRRGQV